MIKQGQIRCVKKFKFSFLFSYVFSAAKQNITLMARSRTERRIETEPLRISELKKIGGKSGKKRGEEENTLIVREREEEEKKRHGLQARKMRRRIRRSIRRRRPTMLTSIVIVIALSPLHQIEIAFEFARSSLWNGRTFFPSSFLLFHLLFIIYFFT